MRLTNGLFCIASSLALTSLDASAQSAGVVYTLSNEVAGNAVLAFDRAPDGHLTPRAAYPTGGSGNGAGLGSQGALTLSYDGHWLFAVNAGSNSVSVFEVVPSGLMLRDVEPSLGTMPTSVSQRESYVFVLNATAPTNIAGFALSNNGQLTPIPGALRPLSAETTAPAQVSIGPGAQQVFVTERATNLIDLFPIQAGGALGVPTFVPSLGMTPFGFEFGKQGTLIVSEAFGGAVNASAVSSYKLGGLGVINNVSPSVPTTETAACWIAITRNGRYAYATNTGSGTVTGYRINVASGALQILNTDGITGDLGLGTNPLDEALSIDSRYLYVISPNTNEIATLRVRNDGSLEKLPSVFGLPSSARGLAAR